MNKEKQIEELAKDICEICRPVTVCKTEGKCTMAYIEAAQLFYKGYRKQSEGEWVDIPDNGNGWYQNGNQIFPKQCSKCGDVYSKAYNYCPNCGAKMKGTKE